MKLVNPSPDNSLTQNEFLKTMLEIAIQFNIAAPYQKQTLNLRNGDQDLDDFIKTNFTESYTKLFINNIGAYFDRENVGFSASFEEPCYIKVNKWYCWSFKDIRIALNDALADQIIKTNANAPIEVETIITRSASGDVLNYLTAVSEGYAVNCQNGAVDLNNQVIDGISYTFYDAVNNWQIGGPLLERMHLTKDSLVVSKLGLGPPGNFQFVAYPKSDEKDHSKHCNGSFLMEAVLRSKALTYFGETAEVPKSLLK